MTSTIQLEVPVRGRQSQHLQEKDSDSDDIDMSDAGPDTDSDDTNPGDVHGAPSQPASASAIASRDSVGTGSFAAQKGTVATAPGAGNFSHQLSGQSTSLTGMMREMPRDGKQDPRSYKGRRHLKEIEAPSQDGDDQFRGDRETPRREHHPCKADQFETERRQLHTKIKELEQDSAEIRQALTDRIVKLEFDNQIVRRDYHECLSDLRSERYRSSDYASKIRVLVENAHKNVESAHWMPESAAEVIRQLDRILEDIKKWSMKFAKRSSDNSLLQLSPKQCMNFLSRDLFPAVGPSQEAIAIKREIPMWLLVSAAVSTVAFCELIGKDFFTFQDTRTETSASVYRQDIGICLEKALRVVEDVDPAGATAWRCQLMRLLDPALDNSNATKTSKESAREARDFVATKLAKHCTDRILTNMLDESSTTEATDQLELIFRICAGLAGRLSVQKTRFEVHGMQRIPSKYDSRSQQLQSHRLHAGQLEDDSEALDGHDIILLASPAVVVSGTPDSTDSDSPLVWKRAVVVIQ